MSTRLVIHLRDRPDALERVFGLLRRRAVAVRRVSLGVGGEGQLVVAVRLAVPLDAAARLRAALLELRDIVRVTAPATAGEEHVRELLLARLAGAPGAAAQPAVMEAVGTPQEIDTLLARLSAHGAVAEFVRSGELSVPAGDPAPEGEST